jgi:glycerol-3-phosphate dehydrogenase
MTANDPMSTDPAVTDLALASGWRDAAWDRLVEGPWDVVVIGGGITGAGIARRAARAGLQTALLERRDFAWGTSSRSSKLVHGGLRYLAHFQLGVVRESVAGREALLQAAPGLVEELGFLMPLYRGVPPGRLVLSAGLAAYDVLAGRRTHRRLALAELELLAPHLRTAALTGGFRYGDAWTDDARLVWRVLEDARAAGATVLSYAAVEDLLRDPAGAVVGVVMRDTATADGAADRGRTGEIHARVVVNATGASADVLRGRLGAPPRIRPLRGSHLFFPSWRLPVAQAISVAHPADGRPVFAYPWEGVTIVGTTDVDDHGDCSTTDEPRISSAEVAYLEEWLAHAFPSLGLAAGDAVASMAGVRPVVGTGKADPSAESREHAVWDDHGLVTVTGGKLTTFDAVARDAVRRIGPSLAGQVTGGVAHATDPGPLDAAIAAGQRNADRLIPRRLAGRFGRQVSQVLAAVADDGDTERIEGTPDLWVAVRWAARGEGVIHLDDLLLRRVRLGLQLPGGGASVLDRVRAIAQPELGWDDHRWQAEEVAYRRRWEAGYAPPGYAPPGEAPPERHP